MRESRTPELRATYRVQVHAGFSLRDAIGIVPYLSDLGVSHLYTSPVLAARTGSRHGYDMTDPRRINPELGTEADLRALADALHQRGMGLLVDIVPNHMCATSENPYWEDVLSHGERSPYAKWFDIEWRMHPDRRVVLPTLRDELDAVIARDELRVRVSEGGARLVHFQMSVPISPDTAPEFLQLAQWDPAVAGEAEARYSGTDGEQRLRQLLDAQHYRLVGWRRGPRELNYRRFFDVTDLVALRAEDPEVFTDTHELILRLVEDHVIDALRVDHVDGLRDPAAYLQRLRDETDRRRPGGIPIYVEKILMINERLRDSWPVDGTTGYERLNDIDDLFIDSEGFAQIEKRYRLLRRLPNLTFESTVRADKRAVLDRAFAADVVRLARMLDTIFSARGDSKTREQIFHGIEEYIAGFPVYRSYIVRSEALHPDDAAWSRAAVPRSEASEETVADVIQQIVSGTETDADPAVRHEFVERMQQLTGPAMAKGLEDTAHYAYVPLVSRNEVAGAPDRPLVGAVERFHASNALYARHHPQSLVATATHDTKRSGDVRARINALSEFPEEWQRAFARWRRLNRRHRQTVHGRIVPDPNAELLLYQTLVGIWPAPRAGRRSDDVPDKAWRSTATERLRQYMVKAVREAKLRTNWTEPDEAYESALMNFVSAILSSSDDDPFASDVAGLVALVAPVARWNSLSRLLLHLTIPGTPDIYQGDESWNFALVDPDNRRPVDYASRRSALDGAIRSDSVIDANALAEHQTPKLLVASRVLAGRRAQPHLFASGDYQPLRASGPFSDHVIAFARSMKNEHAVVLAPRLVRARLAPRGGPDPWSRTSVALPPGLADRQFRCVITGRDASIRDNALMLGETTPDIPFGLFLST